jgi:hypothetical protein
MLSWVISLMLLPLIVLIHVVITLFDVLGAAWLTLCRSCSAVFASFREEKEMRGSDDLAVAQTQSQSCMLRCGASPVEMFDPSLPTGDVCAACTSRRASRSCCATRMAAPSCRSTSCRTTFSGT